MDNEVRPAEEAAESNSNISEQQFFPATNMHDKDVAFNTQGEGTVPSDATVPANGSFLKRSSTSSPKPSPPDKKRHQESDEVLDLHLPSIVTDSEVTVKQRGDKFPSTWTLPGAWEDITLNAGDANAPIFEPKQGTFVETGSTQGEGTEGESSQKWHPASRPRMSVVQKVNDVLGYEGDNNGGHNVPELIESVEIDTKQSRSLGDTVDGEVGVDIVVGEKSEKEKSSNSAKERNSASEIQDICFSPSGADVEVSVSPKQGSFVDKSSSPRLSQNSMEREINFAIGGSNLLPGGEPKQGSFVGTSPNRLSKAVEREINFSPAGSDLQAGPVPRPGSFVEKDYDPTRPRGSMTTERISRIDDSKGSPDTDAEPSFGQNRARSSLFRESNSRNIDKDLREDPYGQVGSLLRERNSRNLDNKDIQLANLFIQRNAEEGENPETIRASVGSAGVVNREINFSPGGSELLTAPPPKQGSFLAGNQSILPQTAELQEEMQEISMEEGNTGAFNSGEEQPQTGTSDEKNVEKRSSRASTGSRSSSAMVREINFNPGGSDFATAPPPKKGSFVGEKPPVIEDNENTNPKKSGLKNQNTKDAVSSDTDSGVGNAIVPREINFIFDDAAKTKLPEGRSSGDAEDAVDGNIIARGIDYNFTGPSCEQQTNELSSGGSADVVVTSREMDFSLFAGGGAAAGMETASEALADRNEDVPIPRKLNFSPDNSAVSPAPPRRHESVDEGRPIGGGESSVVAAVATKEPNNSSESVKNKATNSAMNGNAVGTSNAQDGVNVNGVTAIVDTAVFVGDIYECEKGLENKMVRSMDDVSLKDEHIIVEKESTTANDDDDDDDEMVDLRAEDQTEWKSKKLITNNDSSKADLAQITEESSEAEEDEEQGTVTSEDHGSTEKINTENAPEDTSESQSLGRDSFQPNESILKMEALLESALHEDEDISKGVPDRNTDENIAGTLTDMDHALDSLLEDEDDHVSSNRDNKHGVDNATNGKAAIPNEDSAHLEDSARDMDDFLDSALSDALDAPSQIDPTEFLDVALAESRNRSVKDDSGTEKNDDVDHYSPSESIAKMEAALDSALEDDLDLDDLMKDSPRKSNEQGKKNSESNQVPIADEDASLGSLDALLDDVLDDDSPIAAAPAPEPSSTAVSSKPQALKSAKKAPPKSSSSTKTAPKSGATKSQKRPASKTSGESQQSTNTPKQKTPAPKRTGPRMPMLSGRFSSKSKVTSASTTDKVPKGSNEPKTNDRNKTKESKKMGNARKLMSKMTSWAKRKETPSSNAASNKQKPASAAPAPAPAPAKVSQPKSKPRPVTLVGGKTTSPSVKIAVKKATPTKAVRKSNVNASSPPTMSPASPNLFVPSLPGSATKSVNSLMSQCTVQTFTSPRREGHIGCQAKFQPFLHPSRGPCELCVYFLSEDDKAILDATGRHIRVMFTSGGCCKTCEVFPRDFDEPPVRLCRQCFFNTHRDIYMQVAPKRRILRK